MAKYLVIVESPAKVKTIQKFLGANYVVTASNGHVRDLPKSSLGIEVDKDYEPKYITIRGKGDILANLRKEVKKAEKIFLATDPDREGEAISWHLMFALKLEGKKVYRITFNEITKNAVKESLKNARELDMGLVDAQQARRCLDRMVGYRISPVLWAKVKRGLSAGRVQSVALRIICDREAEIDAFIPQEYWSLEATLKGKGDKKGFVAKYIGNDEKKELESKEQVDAVIKALKDGSFTVTDVKKGERVKKAPLPFTTSTLQQEASKVLNYSTQKTMRLAQQLYEGVELKGGTTQGIITYLRTDSTRVSKEAATTAKEYISEMYGEKYAINIEENQKTGKKIQDAHEAIRPTDIARTPAMVKDSLSREQFRLYQLIWKRYVASRMANALYETVSVKMECNGHRFSAAASKLMFEGFMSVYVEEEDEKKDTGVMLKDIVPGVELKLVDLESKQHFTQPSPHYTEASLVRALEELGIGRPSTYSPTITTILARRYIVKENKNLYVTELGEIVNRIMMEAFPTIVDVNFTATMEALLDGIEEGNVNWKTVISNFYPDLDEAVVKAEKELEEVEIRDEVSDEVCEQCGKPMLIKYGPHGRFLACGGFPECRNTKPYFEKIGVACPKCGKDIVLKKSKKGRKYYGCLSNPECDFMTWQKPSDKKCPECGDILLEKGSKLMCMNDNCGYITEQQKNELSENSKN